MEKHGIGQHWVKRRFGRQIQNRNILPVLVTVLWQQGRFRNFFEKGGKDTGTDKTLTIHMLGRRSPFYLTDPEIYVWL